MKYLQRADRYSAVPSADQYERDDRRAVTRILLGRRSKWWIRAIGNWRNVRIVNSEQWRVVDYRSRAVRRQGRRCFERVTFGIEYIQNALKSVYLFSETLTGIKADVLWVIERKISFYQLERANARSTIKTYKYFRTSANQKLDVSSILPAVTLFTSFRPAAPPFGTVTKVLKLLTALRARS